MSFLPDDFVYHYTTLSQFDECPYSFYLQHVEQQPEAENAFAQFGTLMHQLIDEWAKGVLPASDMPAAWANRYPLQVTACYPPYLKKHDYPNKAYQKAITYLADFQGFAPYEVLCTELTCSTRIAGAPLMGTIDMLLRHPDTGKLVMMDHKSKSQKTCKKDLPKMLRQLYLYSCFVFQKYEQFPTELCFNLFTEGTIVRTPFEKAEYLKVMQWAEDTIRKIQHSELDTFLTPKAKRDFYCMEICGARFHCVRS